MNGLHDVVEQPSAAAAMHQPGCREQALVFSCGGQLLLGILTPAPATARLGMVVVVGGPQYRVGSHRQFVQLARHMAAAGFPTLRFDVRGMGDSPGATPSFEALHNDIEAAVDALVAYEPSLQGVLLFGLCDGASAALMYIGSRRDPRVVGLCLLNPWVRSVESQARAQVRHYYLDRLRQPAFWRKLLSGRLALRAGLELVATLRRAAKPGHLDAQSGADATFQDRMFEGLNRFDRPVLLGLSADDHTAREFEQYCKDRAHWQTLLARPAIRRVLFAGADHVLSSGQHEGAADMLRAMVPCTPGRRAMTMACRSRVAAMAVAVLAALAAPQAALAQTDTSWACGGFDEVQWDYRTATRKQHIEVEGAHFVPKVEALIAGNRGTLEQDINYTLLASPNHHRALVTATRLANRSKTDTPKGFRHSIDCFYLRAIRFASNDVIVRMLYAQHLGKRAREADAVAQLTYAATLAADNPITHQNLGLVYLEIKRYDEALAQAHRAIELGFDAPTLMAGLKSAGKWVEAPTAGIKPSPSPSPGPAASASASAPKAD